MKLTRFGAPLAVITAAAIALTGCATNEAGANPKGTASSLSGTINGVGSSAQGLAETVWASGFQSQNPQVTVNYDPQGSGAGRTSFISGAADFAGSDAALNDGELAGDFAMCKAGTKGIDLPVYISPIAIAYNVAGITSLTLDANTIAGIFNGSITTWNSAAIAALNPGIRLPAAAITVVHRSDDSGTTENFTEYLAAEAKGTWKAPSSQTFPYDIGDAAKGTSGVADAVKNAKNSIAYIDESGAAGLSISKLMVGDQVVSINAAGAAEVVAASPMVSGRSANDLAVAIDRGVTGNKAWPLVLVSYLIVCQQYKDAAVAALAKAYAGYVVSDAAQKDAAAQAGSAPLSSELAAKVRTAVSTIK